MVSSTEIFSETLTYPGLERILYNVQSPAIAISITQISYRSGYLPNADNDKLLLSQIITVNDSPLIADTAEVWIFEGLQLVTFPVSDVYSLRLVFPAWYQEISLEIWTIDGLALAPGSGGVTSQAGLNAAIAQFNAALALKAAAADVATLGAALALKADSSSLADYIDTGELVQALALKADENHNHDDLYYPKAETYNRDEVDALTQSSGGGTLAVVSSPDYAISSHPNGHPTWGGTAASAFLSDGSGNWNTPDAASNVWLGQEFPDPVAIKEIRLRTGYGEGLRDEARVIRRYRIESSSNLNGPWTNYGERITNANPYSQFLTVVPNPQTHQYWRIFVVQGSTAFVAGLQDVQFLA